LLEARSSTFLTGATRSKLKGVSSVSVLIWAHVSHPCITMGINITKLFDIDATERKPIIYVSSEKMYLLINVLSNSGFPNFLNMPAKRAKRQSHKVKN
jgi:hypothetical protein